MAWREGGENNQHHNNLQPIALAVRDQLGDGRVAAGQEQQLGQLDETAGGWHSYDLAWVALVTQRVDDVFGVGSGAWARSVETLGLPRPLPDLYAFPFPAFRSLTFPSSPPPHRFP